MSARSRSPTRASTGSEAFLILGASRRSEAGMLETLTRGFEAAREKLRGVQELREENVEVVY